MGFHATDRDEPAIKRPKLDLSLLFDLLITARNSKDEEALQEAIDMVAIAASAESP